MEEKYVSKMANRHRLLIENREKIEINGVFACGQL